MKRLYILLTLLVAAATHLAAQTDGYKPLVREGVRWVFLDQYIKPFSAEEVEQGKTFPDTIVDCRLYYNEFRGDTVIDELNYKKCYQWTDREVNWSDWLYSDLTEPYLMIREQNHKVCLKLAESNEFAQLCLSQNISDLWTYTGSEIVVYDFYGIENNVAPYDFYKFNSKCDVLIGEEFCKCYQSERFPEYKIVEGVGFISGRYGDMVSPGKERKYPLDGFCTSGLSHLEDANGKILFTGPNYQFYLRYINNQADFTGDGKVDVSDLSAAIDAAVGKTENGKADVNCDGRVDIADVNTVVNVILNAR